MGRVPSMSFPSLTLVTLGWLLLLQCMVPTVAHPSELSCNQLSHAAANHQVIMGWAPKMVPLVQCAKWKACATRPRLEMDQLFHHTSQPPRVYDGSDRRLDAHKLRPPLRHTLRRAWALPEGYLPHATLRPQWRLYGGEWMCVWPL